MRITPNRLSQEKSLYLRQHQNNPVDWYPWGPEALEKAKRENKPIFLSIGYSACHWCHVMEHESFENSAIALFLNQEFVPIKVDREERPDLDHVYQNVAQAMTRTGGWPLSVFLTPELKPFYGGTYFPPEDRYGRPGFSRVLRALAEAHRQDRASVEENATRLLEYIRDAEAIGPLPVAALGRKPWDNAAAAILSRMDMTYGGLAGAPKFPNTMILSFLLRYGSAAGEKMPTQAVERALDAMACGGIFDQVGGGFHRYSVDELWSVPHFEKMLYDNGLLLQLYAEATLLLGSRPLWESTLRKTVEYLRREMRGADGIYYAAQDADSEGHEGKFFVWTPAELIAVLGEADGAEAARVLGVTEGGNFEDGRTVLYLAQGKLLKEEWRRKLLAARAERVAPATDTKGIVAWNAYLVSGLAWAARALNDTEIEHESRMLFAQLWRAAWDSNEKKLAHIVQEGVSRGSAFLDDVAQLAQAGLDLIRFGGLELEVDGYRIQDTVRELGEVLVRRFHDAESGGFWLTPSDGEPLVQRPKSFFDQAVPAGASVALGVLSLGGVLFQDFPGRTIVEGEMPQWSALAKRQAMGMGQLLCAALLHEMGPVVVTGAPATVAHPHLFLEKEGEPEQWCWRETCQKGSDWAPAVRLPSDS